MTLRAVAPTPRRGVRMAMLYAVLGLLLWSGSARATPAPPLVYVLPISGVIDLGLAPFVERILGEASQAGAAAVILDINTFGGRVDAAVLIRDALLRAPLRTVAFVNTRAISAGALISLAAENIVMASGGTIGAAAPVTTGLPGAAPQAASEKTVSYLRKEFRATAESRRRPLAFAEAMVDADVVIPEVNEKGKLLTLTTEEALQHKLADARAESVQGVLTWLDLSGAELRRPGPTWAEVLVRFLTHPVMSSVLMTLGLLGLLIELQSPGLGLPGAVGLTSLVLFFWGHWLVQIAGWEELLLVVLGLGLLLLEIFVIPGFGLAGVLGITSLIAGLSLSVLGTGATWEAIGLVAGRVMLSLLLAIVLSLALLRVLPGLPWGQRLILETVLPTEVEYPNAPEPLRHWLGTRGRTLSPLRPAGIADLEGERVDVVSDGAFIEVGTPIRVIRVDGNRIVVRQVDDPPERTEA